MRSQYFLDPIHAKIKFIRYSLIPVLQHSKLILALPALKKIVGGDSNTQMLSPRTYICDTRDFINLDDKLLFILSSLV